MQPENDLKPDVEPKLAKKSKNAAKRLNQALRIYDRNKKGVFKLNKATRVGATTSLVLGSHALREKCLIVVPTNEIAEKTIKEDLMPVCEENNLPKPRVIQIYSNHHCLYNILERERLDNSTSEEDKNKLEMLKNLSALPRRPKCGYECEHFEHCECMQVLQDEADILVITHAKLTNLMRPREEDDKGINGEILDKLLECRNIIIDESHRLENITSEETLIVESTKQGENWIKAFNENFRKQKYLSLVNQMKQVTGKDGNEKEVPIYYNLYKIILHLAQIFTNRQVLDIIKTAGEKPESFKKLIVTNPTKKSRFNTIKRKDHVSYTGLTSEFHEIIMSGEAEKYSLKINELNGFLNFVNIVNAKQIQATSTLKDDVLNIYLQDAESKTQTLLSSFLRKAVEMEGEKRIIFSTATFGSFDYSKFLKRGMEIKEISFGKSGDPLKTASKQTLILHKMDLCSNPKFQNSIHNNLAKIVSFITGCIDSVGTDLFICTMTKASAKVIQEALNKLGFDIPVTYYRSSITTGVKCSARVGIFIGGAYIPIDAMKDVSKTKSEAIQKALESMFLDMWQAISRVKDPDGEVKSAAILMMNERDAAQMIAFVNGYDSTTEKFKINVPKATRWEKVDFKNLRKLVGITSISDGKTPISIADDTVTRGMKNSPANFGKIFDSESQQYNSLIHQTTYKKYLPLYEVLYNIYEVPVKNGRKVDSEQFCLKREDFQNGAEKCQLITKLDDFHRKHEFLAATDSESEKVYFHWKLGLNTFSDSDLMRHREGREPLKSQIIGTDDKVRYIKFGNLQPTELNLIMDHLKGKFEPTITMDQKTGTYSIWIFVNPVSADVANKTAKAILKEIKDKMKVRIDCDISPYYGSYKSAISHKRELNECKLPLYGGELAFNDGVFSDDIDEIIVSIHDLEESPCVNTRSSLEIPVSAL